MCVLTIEVSIGPMAYLREATQYLLEETQVPLRAAGVEKVGTNAPFTPALLTQLRRRSSLSAKVLKRQMLISRLAVPYALTPHAVASSTARHRNLCRIRASDYRRSSNMA